MAVVVSNVIPGADAQMYDNVSEKLGISREQLPDGCSLHIASPVSDGWRVISVWDSREDFDRFVQDKLVPTLREVASGDAPAPQPDVQDVYKLITT